MKLKKTIISALLAVAMLVGVGAGALAAAENSLPEPQETYYLSFSGTVTEIFPFYDGDEPVEGKYFVHVSGQDDALINFVVDENTYMFTEGELKKGAEVTAYYLYGLPMILIYPPQYPAVAMAVEYDGEQSIFVDRFDENLLSADASLYIKTGENTEVVDSTGAKYEGSLEGEVLAVFYTVAAQSLPAQTTPEKIIVLSAPAKSGLDDDTISWLKENVPGMEIVVEGNIIEAPAAYADDSGTVMVPIRAIGEALGYEVVWLSESRGVTLDGKYTFYIGQDGYSIGKAAPMALGTAPELVNSLSYVPIKFFTEIMGMNNAYVFEGQIVIDNGEKMQ